MYEFNTICDKILWGGLFFENFYNILRNNLLKGTMSYSVCLSTVGGGVTSAIGAIGAICIGAIGAIIFRNILLKGTMSYIVCFSIDIVGGGVSQNPGCWV